MEFIVLTDLCLKEVVIFRDQKYLTLDQVFESLNLTAYDLSIDTLDMHVGYHTALPRVRAHGL